MKFICNNCGFQAEIPEKKVRCPMCGSKNTRFEKQDVKTKNTKKQSEKQSEKKRVGDARSPKITLTDDFFEQKPTHEEDEIADVINEIAKQTPKKTKSSPLLITAVFIIIFAAAGYYSYMHTKSSDEYQDPQELFAAKEVVLNDTQHNEKQNQEDKKNEDKTSEIETAVNVDDNEHSKASEKLEHKTVQVKEEKKEIVVTVKAKQIVEKKKSKRKLKGKKKEKAQRVKRTRKIQKRKTNSYKHNISEGHRSISQKRYSDALHAYKAALRKNPQAYKVYKYIGIAYASKGNRKKACEYYSKYVRYLPNAPDTLQVKEELKSCK